MPAGPAAVEFLRTLAPGTRVVVRRREDDGFYDALGELREITETTCTIDTRSGSQTIPLAKVIRAKTVPPPPPRRSPRFPPAPRPSPGP